MPILKNVEFHWVATDPESPQQFKGKGRRRWGVQIRTQDDKEAKRWQKEFGFKVTMEKDDDGNLYHRAKLSRNAYAAEEGSSGQVDDLEKPQKPPAVIFADGSPIDGSEVGNGSVGDVSFNHFVRDDGEAFRTLKTLCIRKWIKREPYVDPDQFDLNDDGEIVEESKEEENGDGLF